MFAKELPKRLPKEMEHAVNALKKSKSKEECLRKAYTILTRRYHGQRIETYTPIHTLFFSDLTHLWKKMYHYFIYKHDEFLEHYHKRSNAETCFHMIKTKFGSNLKSKKQIAQINELLIKVLAHNVCVVIQEVNELGVKAEFKIEETLEKE